MKAIAAHHKTMVKLVWTMAVVVLIVGLVRLVMVYQATHNTDRNLIQRSK